MKRFRILTITIILFCFTFNLISLSSFEFNEVTSYSSATSNSNNFNKIHFYYNYESDNYDKSLFSINKDSYVDYSFIDNKNELDDAIEDITLACSENKKNNGVVKITVEFTSNYLNTDEYIKFDEELSKVQTVEERKELRKRQNSFCKEYYHKENKRNASLLESLDYESLEMIDYAPFIALEIEKDKLDSEALANLTKNNTIKNISLALEEKPSDTESWNNTLKAIEAYSTVHSGLYTGQGIRIGILEVGGVCDTEHTNLENKNITVHESSQTISDHATAVTSIIALMAPDADIYVSSVFSQRYNGLQWFIDNNCDVVNCSFSYYGTALNEDGTYDVVYSGYRYDIDGLYDSQIRNTGIVVVTSAGNVCTNIYDEAYNPNNEVRSPGLSHNSITVGGLSREPSLLTYKLYSHNHSCYNTNPSSYAKPEVSAIYEVDIPNIGLKQGNSFTAPQITAAIALLFERYPAYIGSPFGVKTAIIATANQTDDYLETHGGFDDKVGAGSLDFYQMRTYDLESKILLRSSSNSTPNSNVYNQTLNLSKNDQLQAAICWSFKNTNTAELINSTNFDLRLYDQNSNLVCQSNLDLNNGSELIRYKAPSSGTYTLSIYLNGEIVPIGTRESIYLVYSY